MKIKLLSLFIVCAAMIFALAGCATAPASTTSSAAPTGTQSSGPWPGVPVYSDPASPITTRVNETFSIVLPPAALFGWGWQDQDLSAFNLQETKTVPGPNNEPNTYGPNAFLFKALKEGTFQIMLYAASKPPQQVETFDIVVKP